MIYECRIIILEGFPLTLPLFHIDIPEDEYKNAKDAIQCEVWYLGMELSPLGGLLEEYN